MTNALSQFLRQRMDERGLRNRDVEQMSGLSRQLVSKYVADDRETLSRLPDRATIEGFARALSVSPALLLSRATEALGLGYEGGDFINNVATATDDELMSELHRRLTMYASDAAALRALESVTDDDKFSEAAGVVLRGRFAQRTVASPLDVDVVEASIDFDQDLEDQPADEMPDPIYNETPEDRAARKKEKR